MSAENKALVQRFSEEVLNRRDFSVGGAILAPDFRFHFAGRTEPMDRESFEQTLAVFHAGFPDITFTLEDLIAEGDRVAARFRMSGTHQGEFLGVATTGKRASWPGIAFFRIAGGKIAEEWAMPDVLSLLRQLGVAPGQTAR